MARNTFDTSFNFGANVKAKKAPATGSKKGGKRTSPPPRNTQPPCT